MSYSFLSDDSKQDAATTPAHSNRLILKKLEKTIMSSLSTMRENTDGCAEQYRYATALYIMSVLSQGHSIIFNWGISEPGYVKEVIDGLNAIDKRFMYQLMSNVQLTGSKTFEKYILTHSFTQIKDISMDQ